MAPSAWQVASNGVETRRTQLTSDPDTSRWDFAPTKAMSTYITTVLAGPYFKAEDSWRGTLADGTGLDVPLALYCRASMAPSFDPEALFTLTKNGLDFFNELFDFPYPWGKYDQAFVPEYNLGAMENPGLVTFTENYVFTSRAADSQYQARANTLLHEMAHMWFGDLVTMQWWDDLWLKESFADYMGTLGVDRTTDWATAWVNFANNRKAWAYVQDQLPTTHPIVADIPDLEAAKQNFDGITYAKGASVLKQLVAYVGFEAFVAGSRRYFKDHAYGNTTLADLLAALSAASGRDLADWARQWLQTSGISTLTTGIEEHDGVLGTVTLAPGRRGPDDGPAGAAAAPAADRPVRDGRRRRPGPHRQRRDRRQRRPDRGAGPGRQAAAGPAAGQRRGPQLRQGPAGPALRGHRPGSLGALSDPMARALCWTALWDSARDAVTPSALYVDAVQRFGPAETGIGVLLNVLGNASTAIERYVPAAGRAAVRHGFLSLAADELQRAAPGSDQQLAWARTVAATSRYDGSRLDLLRGILDGSTVIEGLSVDAELRWNLWHALAANGQATAAQLDGELARDNTAAGRSGHATALAARPEAAVKEAAWTEAVHGTSLSNQLLSATIAGFNTGPGGAAGRIRGPLLRVPGGGVGRAQHRNRQPDCPRALPGRPGPGRRHSGHARGHRPDGRVACRTPGRPAGAAPHHHRTAQPPAPLPHGAGPDREPRVGCSVTALLAAQNGSYGAIDGMCTGLSGDAVQPLRGAELGLDPLLGRGEFGVGELRRRRGVAFREDLHHGRDDLGRGPGRSAGGADPPASSRSRVPLSESFSLPIRRTSTILSASMS